MSGIGLDRQGFTILTRAIVGSRREPCLPRLLQVALDWRFVRLCAMDLSMGGTLS